MLAARQAQPLVTLRVDAGTQGVVVVVPSRPIIKELAAEWMYILRNRSRWSGDEDLRGELRVRAAETLAKLGVGETELRSIVAARTRHVEVEFHDPEEKPAARAADRRPTKQEQEEAERRELLDARRSFHGSSCSAPRRGNTAGRTR
jgi:hypothetical protein